MNPIEAKTKHLITPFVNISNNKPSKDVFFFRGIIIILFTMILINAFWIEPAMARDLVDAAQNAQSFFNKLGVAALGIGVSVGGILFAVGASNMGRMVLISGFVGALAILGGPAGINALAHIFGVSA